MIKFYLCVGALCASASAVFAQQNTINPSDYFGDLKARHIGPALMSGRVCDIEGHPTNSDLLYIGAAGGGVWKSQDAGLTFSPIFDSYCQSIGAIALAPSDPDNTVWVGTGEVWTRNSVSIGDGIYQSNDGGKNWKHKGLAKSERISAIEIDPTNKDIVYAGVLGGLWSNSADRGVYKTTDAGNTWEKILFVNETTGCSDLIMDPNNPQVLYAAFWEFRRTAYSFNSGGMSSALYKTTDGGKTWSKIQVGFPQGQLGRIAVAVAPSNSNILYAVVEAEKDKGLYRSDDAGSTWKFLNGDFELTVRPFYFSRISIDPKDPNILYKGGLSGSISRDGGHTFKTLGGMHSDIHDIWIDPAETRRIIVATDGGVYRSSNQGTSLQIVENLPLSQFYHVSIDHREPFYVYGGLQDNNSWFGPSESPGGVEARDWELVGQGDGFRVYPHPTQPEIVYSEMQGAEQVWRFDTKNQQVRNVKPFPAAGDPKLRFNWNTPITTSIHAPDRLYIGSQFLHVSDDRGSSWRKISPDLTTNDPKKQLQESSGGLSADNS
ncbi:MAG: WD40/YVTN/BNR-like repeat-containing protein, partial [Flavobacteriales bacterium]